MKKKYGLLKVLVVLLLIVALLSFFIEGRQGTITYLALGDIFLNFLQSFYYFFDTALFILAVGGFYGLLNRIPAYKKLVKGIASFVANKSKLFVIIVTIAFALISSLTGLNILLLVFVPFIVSIILLLGYDKLVALSATIGGSIVGLIGGIFVTFRDLSNQYAYSYTTFDKLVGLESNWATLLPRILLLIVSTGLLVFYIINHIKKHETADLACELSKGDALFVEVKDKTGKKVVTDDKVSSFQFGIMIISLIVLFILLVLGYFPWGDLFELTIFDTFHTNLVTPTFADGKYVFLILSVLVFVFAIYLLVKKIRKQELNVKVGSIVSIVALLSIVMTVIFGVYTFGLISDTSFGKWVAGLPLWESSIFSTILSSAFTSFGTWNTQLGVYMITIILMIVVGVILALINKVKADDAIDGFIYGIKKMIPATIVVILAYTVLICSFNNGFTETIITNVSDKFGDNAFAHAIVSIFGTVLCVDGPYTASGIFSSIVATLSETANLSIYSVLFQSVFGLVQIFGPTSILLLVGLSYLEVPYKNWIKYIWRFVVELIIVILLALMIVSLL